MSTPTSARRSLGDRAVAAYPLVAAFVGLLFLYAYQTTQHPAPWLFLDELQWAELSRSVAHTGHPQLRLHPAAFESLYTYFLAPAWLAGHATSVGYAAAKYLNAIVMTASIFPAYGLTRLFAPRLPAVVAATAAASIPALVYTATLIPEPLAYFWSTLTLWLLARALLLPGRATVAWAVGAIAVAPVVRSQLAVLSAAALVALAVMAVTSGRGRAIRAYWSRSDRLRVALLFLGLGIAANAFLTQHSYSWQIGTHFHHRLWTYGLWAVGAFAIGIGVLPVLLALAWAVRPPSETRGDRVLFSVLVGSAAAFVLYTGVKASYISTNFAVRVEERNLVYLAPVVFAVCARWTLERRPRVLGVALAGGALWYLIDSTPYNLDTRFYSDAPGLAILAWFNRTFALTPDGVRWVLLGVLAFAILFALTAPRARALTRGRHVVGAAAIAVVACLVVAWNLTGEIAAANGSQAAAEAEIGSLPRPPDFVDRATGGRRTMFVGAALADGHAILSLEFWNRSIQDIWSVDATAPPRPGPTTTPNFASASGIVDPQLPLDWGLVGTNVGLAGQEVANENGLSVVRLAKPIRITHEVNGVTGDGWMASDSWFGQFTGGRGVAVIALSRRAACGNIAPARVTIRVSRVRIDKNAQPAAGRLLAVRRKIVRSTTGDLCDEPTVRIPVHTPYRVDVHSTGFIPKSQFEQRDLSVKVAFAFEPDATR